MGIISIVLDQGWGTEGHIAYRPHSSGGQSQRQPFTGSLTLSSVGNIPVTQIPEVSFYTETL